jgi:ABC-type antimicrobial peptide transport system permease subunit
MLRRIRLEVGKLDTNIAISEDMPMTEGLARLFTPLRLLGSALGYSGILSLVLSSIGLYGLISFAVNQRTKEIGLRMALGSSPVSVLQLMIREGIRLTFLGLLIGLPLTAFSTRLLSAYLYGVSSWDPATLASVVLLMGSIAAIACYLPARRAAKVDPMTALRQD